MDRSKIYTILSNFNKIELNGFRLFLKSPYFNKSQNVIKLFDILRPHYPDFTSRILDKDILHFKIFHSRNKSSRSIDNLFTRLRKLCENYLSVSTLNAVEYEKNLALVEQFNYRKLYSLFEHKIDTLLDKIDTAKPLSSKQFYYLFNLQFLKTNYIFNHSHIEKDREIFDELSQCFLLLGKFSFSSKIKIFVRLVILTYYTNSFQKLDKTFLLLVKDIHDSSEYNIHPAARIFSSVAESILNNRKFDYFGLKKELFTIQDKITTEDFNLALILLVLYFHPMIDESDKNLVRERFEHMKLLIERKAWNTAEGNLREKNFSIIVNSAIKAGEIDWAENFIKFYSIYVVKEHRANAINFNMALLFYTKAGSVKFNKEEYYKKAFEYLSHFRVQDYTNKLQIYLLKTMLFFDSGEFDGVYSESKALEQYILHNKEHLNPKVADSYMLHNKYLKSITNNILDKNLTGLLKMSGKIKNDKPFINKEWLMERISKSV